MSDPAPGTNGETAAHRDLKRLALVWAQTNGFRIAAAEVSLPNHRVRMDIAACPMVPVWRSSPPGTSDLTPQPSR